MVIPAIRPDNSDFDQKTDEPPIRWTSISLQEIVERNHRMQAFLYGIEGRQAREIVEKCRWPSTFLCGESGAGLATSYHRPRFKRIYVEKPGLPFFLPSQINDLYPKPTKYISEATKTDIEALRVKKGQVLMTCSGTIGFCTYVSNTLDGLLFSHDVIRIDPVEYGGYLYAFLKSKTGFAIINSDNYGAVVKHIEPKHLNQARIPDPPSVIKLQIHKTIEESFKLRDESNELMNEAQGRLKDALRLPSVEAVMAQVEQYDKKANVLNFSVPLSELDNRFDGSFHASFVNAIERHFEKIEIEVTTIGDCGISQSIILPGRFTRVFVEEGEGTVFFGGRQLLQLDPTNKKYLSGKIHGDRIRGELALRKNMVVLSCSGTIGKVNIVPEHWEEWTLNQHVIRVVPANDAIAGYIYAWLSSDFAQPLIARYIYGSTVDEIDAKQVSGILLPLLHSRNEQRAINQKILEANEKRTEAYHLEQRALTILNEKVLYAR